MQYTLQSPHDYQEFVYTATQARTTHTKKSYVPYLPACSATGTPLRPTMKGTPAGRQASDKSCQGTALRCLENKNGRRNGLYFSGPGVSKRNTFVLVHQLPLRYVYERTHPVRPFGAIRTLLDPLIAKTEGGPLTAGMLPPLRFSTKGNPITPVDLSRPPCCVTLKSCCRQNLGGNENPVN